MPELFDKHGGFRKLHTFTLATIVQLDTLHFCRRFLTSDPREAGYKFYDPKGRQYDPSLDRPQRGKPMRRRKSAKGDFWGCSAFPDCKGTRPT